MYNADYISALGDAVKAQLTSFDQAGFEHWLLSEPWPELALKARMQRISEALSRFIELDYEATLALLKPVSSQFGGGSQGDYASMFFPEFVAQYGLDHFDVSIDALAHFTRYSSAEFAVRPFIVRYPDKMMAQMLLWAQSPDYFVRRLASEGCRPRLPWAMALPAFKQNPEPIFPILHQLNNDPELFVRRSVANNLNDIAKDHPQRVLAFARQTFGRNPASDWVVKHGLRSLLKQAEPEALALFNFEPPTHIHIDQFTLDKTVIMGDSFHFSFRLNSPQTLGKLRIEYAIDFMKANAKQRRKIFQISESKLSVQTKTVSKLQSFRPISTRKHYPGEHRLTIIINGKPLASENFLLLEGSH